MRPVTVWQRWDSKNRVWKHNHIEFEHNPDPEPTPQSKEQQCWKDLKWKKQFRHLNSDYKVI